MRTRGRSYEEKPEFPQRRRPLHDTGMDPENTSPRRSQRHMAPGIHNSSFGSNEHLDSSDSESDENGRQNEDRNDKIKYGRRRLSIDDSAESYVASGENIKKVSPHPKKHKKTSGGNIFIYIVLSIMVILLGIICYSRFNGTYSLSKQELTDEIKIIRGEFPSQVPNVWITFSAGIKRVDEKNPSQPSVFLLLHDKEEDTPICLARILGKLATRFLNATNPNPLIIKGEQLGRNQTYLDDYGEFINDKKLEVEERRSMIVYDLHKIPAELARSFQSFCDVETPLVNKAVYFFTLRASGASGVVDSPTALAEEVLTKLWGHTLDTDILQPLIIRMTDNVVVIKHENIPAPSCQR